MGKSLFINFLAGRAIVEKQKEDVEGDGGLRTVVDVDNPLEGFKVPPHSLRFCVWGYWVCGLGACGAAETESSDFWFRGRVFLYRAPWFEVQSSGCVWPLVSVDRSRVDPAILCGQAAVG